MNAEGNLTTHRENVGAFGIGPVNEKAQDVTGIHSHRYDPWAGTADLGIFDGRRLELDAPLVGESGS